MLLGCLWAASPVVEMTITNSVALLGRCFSHPYTLRLHPIAIWNATKFIILAHFDSVFICNEAPTCESWCALIVKVNVSERLSLHISCAENSRYTTSQRGVDAARCALVNRPIKQHGVRWRIYQVSRGSILFAEAIWVGYVACTAHSATRRKITRYWKLFFGGSLVISWYIVAVAEI